MRDVVDGQADGEDDGDALGDADLPPREDEQRENAADVAAHGRDADGRHDHVRRRRAHDGGADADGERDAGHGRLHKALTELDERPCPAHDLEHVRRAVAHDGARACLESLPALQLSPHRRDEVAVPHRVVHRQARPHHLARGAPPKVLHEVRVGRHVALRAAVRGLVVGDEGRDGGVDLLVGQRGPAAGRRLGPLAVDEGGELPRPAVHLPV
mmetsp:Transcript_15763/g.54758  ORF Transcript_15763/g.54758 Transcript_15763/m.54758 type:complete len:213 (+) Transcript_15763:1502-2140(+)